MPAFNTVADYFTQARALLQDLVSPYRYDDPTMLLAMNNGFLEMWRVRRDLFIGLKVPPSFTAITDAVPLDPQFQTPLVYFLAGFAQLRDDEINQDGRATVFMNKAEAALIRPMSS